MSLSGNAPTARATMTATIPKNGTAGLAASVPGSPPSNRPGASYPGRELSGSSLGSHSLTMTMRHATQPMRISTSAKNGLKRVALKNIQFGCVFGPMTPSMNAHPFVSYEYAIFAMSDTAVRATMAVFRPRLRQLATDGSAKGSAAVANVSADKNHVGAFQSSACIGNHAWVRVKVIRACHAVATGPLYRTSAYAKTHANAIRARR